MPWHYYPNTDVFSDCQNLLYDKSASFRCDGRLIHSPGPAAADALSPKVLYIQSTLHSWSDKVFNTGHPPYLTELLQYHKPARSTHSSASHLFSVPRHNLSFDARTFRIASPKIWNSSHPPIPNILFLQTSS